MTSLLLQDHILNQALGALAQKRAGHTPIITPPKLAPSGAALLYPEGFFPWQSLPYPQEHARLGGCFAELGEIRVAEQLARFQRALCDHNGKPIPSLFCQEGKVSFEELQKATQSFFDLVGVPNLSLPFIDDELGFVRCGDHETTIALTGSGCITGLGTYLHRDAGVLTFGPQLSSVGNCRAFGIAGRPSHWKGDLQTMTFSYQNRLAAPHPRETGISFLSDSGFSGLWVDIQQQLRGMQLTTEATVMGPGDPTGLCWTLFGRAQTCLVDGFHRLSANSLDRYQGPIKVCEMVCQSGCVKISSPVEGSMEVIPLAGDDSFWGANFLVAYRPRQFSKMEVNLSS